MKLPRPPKIPCLLLATASLLFLPTSLLAQIVVASAVSEADEAPDDGTSTHTIDDFEVVAGTNRKLVVVVGTETATPLNVSYGGVNLIQAITRKTASSTSSIWYLDNPPVGTADVFVSGDGPNGSNVGVLSLQDAAPGVHFTDGLSNASQISYSTTFPNTLVVTGYADNDIGALTTFEAPAGLTQLFEDGTGLSARVVAAYGNLATAGPYTHVFGDSINQPTIALAAFVPYDPTQIYVVNSASNYDSDANNTTNTIPGFTVDAGSGRKLVLSINSESAGTIASITYGDQSFSPAVASASSNRYSQIWYLDAPAAGSADIVATYTANGRSRMGVVSLQNAAPGGPAASNSVNVGATSISLTTTQANTFVIGSYIQNNGSGNPTGPAVFTNLYNGDSGSSNSDAGYATEALAGLQTYTWTSTPASTGGIAVAGFTAFDPTLVYVMNSATNHDNDGGTDTNTIADFVVASGSDRKLVLTINTETGGSISSITYGAQSFTLAEYNSLANGRLAQIWYLDNPDVGTHSITATYTAVARSRMAVISLQNVEAGGPIVSNSIVNGASSIDLTTTRANTLVIGTYVQNTDPATIPDPFSTTLYNATSGSSWALAGYRNEALAGLKTYSYAGSDGGAGIAVAGFAPATAPAPSPVLEITAFSFDPTGATSSSISFSAAASSAYLLKSSANLADGFANTVTPTAATVGSLAGITITTDASGHASVQFTTSGAKNFFRIQTAP